MPERHVDETRPSVIDAAHIAHQRAWSLDTFGPGDRLLGVIDHIEKELVEVREAPADLSEWVDVIILGFDGAWRAGHEPQAIIDAIKAKQARNEARTWPDWRTLPTDRAIEHDRSQDGQFGGQLEGGEIVQTIRRAISDPGSFTPRRRERLYGEPMVEWQARAVLDALGLKQVGWMGPFGIVPGGMDVDATDYWQPIYMVVSGGQLEGGE